MTNQEYKNTIAMIIVGTILGLLVSGVILLQMFKYSFIEVQSNEYHVNIERLMERAEKTCVDKMESFSIKENVLSVQCGVN